MRTVEVKTPSAQYPVRIGRGLLPALARAAAGRRTFVLSSPPVWELWGSALMTEFAGQPEPCVLMLPPGESAKRLSEAERLLEEMAGAGADRGSLLIAFGGGVVGDMCGFLAAVYMRGIRYIQAPTTLLAQVDSSIGGKTGVNLAAGKNLVGAFHHPEAVFADVDLLRTLPARELRAGLMESVKAGILRDAGLFALLEEARKWTPKILQEVVTRSVAMKAEIVGLDEKERGLRMILNLGHTLGHAIEAVTGYSVLLHGEAVGWGMLAAFALARERGLMAEEDAARAGALVRRLGELPGFTASAEDLLAATGRDKKNDRGMRRFVLPLGIGNAVVVENMGDVELLGAAEMILEEARCA